MKLFVILGIILVVVLIALVVLYFIGKRLEKKNEANKEVMEANAQTVSMLVIDKKKMKLREANLPKIVLESTPKYLRRSKVPIVKAKIGPKILSLMCAPELYDQIPVKQEIKATVSGLYITGARGKLLPKPTKRTWKQKLMDKVSKR